MAICPIMDAADMSRDYHQLETEEVVELLGSDPLRGLNFAEVEERLDRFGPNEIASHRSKSVWRRWLGQFHQPLVYVLLVSTLVALFLSQWVDASVIFGIVLVNAFVGFLQENKAEKTIDALAKLVITRATVRRAGEVLEVPARELVPGDVVVLHGGDRVAADLRLFGARNLHVDESMLTGESVPVAKHVRRMALETILAERGNVAYAGTLVTSGQGEGLVWATGERTEMGRIAELLGGAADLETPLTRKIAAFSRLLMVVILSLAVVTFAAGVARGEPMGVMFMAAVALAVGAIPEGLPAAVTVMLAVGVARMAKRRAIVRQLPAVETLGSTTVICSDKTGTLTENQMTVREIFAGGRSFDVSGGGLDPVGEIRERSGEGGETGNVALEECLKAGVLCNDSAVVSNDDGRRTVRGDPTEAALIVVAEKGGLLGRELADHLPRIDTLAFESESQYMATLHHRGDGRERVIYKKGAVERLLEKCHDTLGADGRLTALDATAALRVAEEMAAQGLRVLGFARRLTPVGQAQIDHQHVAAGMTFLGLQGMIDPPRAEAIRAVARCREAGIAVKMITGDHLLTATAIARQLGLDDGASRAVSGRELEHCTEAELPALADSTAVFARVAPEQKLRLVRALQSRGHIVAMTGDGVNDAPALKQADIGVAMGVTGTDVAKSAADIVLLDDNFATIESAIEEGRAVFDNLRKFIVWEIPTNFGEGLILLSAILFGTTLPALPVQLLWVNMVTAVVLGFALIFEPKEDDLMMRPPRDPQRPMFDFPLFMRTGLITLIILVGGFGLFLWEKNVRRVPIEEARTVVVNLVVVVEMFYLLSCRSLMRPVRAIGFWSNPWVMPGLALMLGLQLLYTYAPPMNRWFGSAPIDAGAWWRITAVGGFAYAAVSLEKWLRRRSNGSPRNAGYAESFMRSVQPVKAPTIQHYVDAGKD
jgi:cation-transporting ATPase F